MRNYNLPRMIIVAILLSFSGILFASALLIDVSAIYYNQGNIHVEIITEGQMGDYDDAYFSPTVYCCGPQTLTWDPSPFYNVEATVIVTQGDRTQTQQHVYIYPNGQVTHLYFNLPTIKNFQHKPEM